LFNWLAANKDAFAGLASIFSVVGTVVAVIIFFSGVRQYKKAENWKKTEFLAKLYSEFSNDPPSLHAFWMIDGDDRTIFFEEGDAYVAYPVNLQSISNALRRYVPRTEFSALDLHIRDSFDSFFVYIEQFDRAIENGLVDKDEVIPYFTYWIGRLNSPDEDADEEKLRIKVLDYIDAIGYVHVQRFLTRWPNQEAA
jgi:hypothetical protein